MADHAWVREFPGSITVCDPEGVILEMNDRAIQAFRSQGGQALLGTNLLDCHPEPSRTKVRQMLRTRQANVYTIEKDGVHRFIYQTPWYRDGQYAGLIELALDIPADMPHFIRDGQ
jgi:PAS domain-containing protein